MMYFNGNFASQAIVNHTKTPVPGAQKVKNQFLILGQEPDKFLGGFDKEQLLKGKISQVSDPFTVFFLAIIIKKFLFNSFSFDNTCDISVQLVEQSSSALHNLCNGHLSTQPNRQHCGLGKERL